MRDTTKIGLLSFFFLAISYIVQKDFFDLSIGFYMMGFVLCFIWFLINNAEEKLLNEIKKIRRKNK